MSDTRREWTEIDPIFWSRNVAGGYLTIGTGGTDRWPDGVSWPDDLTWEWQWWLYFSPAGAGVSDDDMDTIVIASGHCRFLKDAFADADRVVAAHEARRTAEAIATSPREPPTSK